MNELNISGDNHGQIKQSKTVNIALISTKDRVPSVVPCLLVIFLLCVAPFVKVPYGFFVLIRLMTCGAFAYIIYCSSFRSIKFIAGAFIVLYNPILPIYLNREIWSVVNFLTAFVLLVLYIILNISARRKIKHSKIGFQEE